jgi:hypothetical protein
MISLEEFKDALGDKVNELTEEQIIKLLDNQDKMAELFFSMWMEERKKNLK